MTWLGFLQTIGEWGFAAFAALSAFHPSRLRSSFAKIASVLGFFALFAQLILAMRLEDSLFALPEYLPFYLFALAVLAWSGAQYLTKSHDLSGEFAVPEPPRRKPQKRTESFLGDSVDIPTVQWRYFRNRLLKRGVRHASITGVPPIAFGLQADAAKAFFFQLGINVVPWPAVARIKRFDVDFALWDFADDLGFDYDILLSPSHGQHFQSRVRFAEVANTLHEARAITHGTPISPAPVLQGLRESLDSGTALLQRLQDVAGVWYVVAHEPAWIHDHIQFVQTVSDAMTTWDLIPPEDLDALYTAARQFHELSQRTSSLLDGTRSLILAALAGDMADDNRLLAAAVLQAVEDLRNRFVAGGYDLDELLNDLETLEAEAVTVAGTSSPFSSSPPTAEERIKKCLADLGLSLGASWKDIQQAWRRLSQSVQSVYNTPDPPPGDLAKAQQYNEAWNALKMEKQKGWVFA